MTFNIPKPITYLSAVALITLYSCNNSYENNCSTCPEPAKKNIINNSKNKITKPSPKKIEKEVDTISAIVFDTIPNCEETRTYFIEDRKNDFSKKDYGWDQ